MYLSKFPQIQITLPVHFVNRKTIVFKEFRTLKKTKQLAGSITKAIKEYRVINPDLTRLIIHFYKVMNQKELKLDIPIFIVTINKTASSDIVIFDRDWAELMPLSGTYLNVNKNTFLLCNNTRHSDKNNSKTDSYPFFVKLKFACTDEEQLQGPQIWVNRHLWCLKLLKVTV